MKKITAVFFLFSFHLGFGEIIDGPANVRDAINGRVLFQLFDGVEVDCTPLDNNWFRIGITVKSTKEKFETDLPPKKGDTLVNLKGKPIGIVLSDFHEFNDDYGNWHSGADRYGMDIIGYTFKGNIKPESIIENRLNQLINSKESPWKKDDFNSLIKEFNMLNHGLLRGDPTIQQFMYYENVIDDPSPMDRIRLIFKDELLIGIIHTRSINTNQGEDFNLVRDRILFIPNYVTIDRASFVQKNIESYNGVD